MQHGTVGRVRGSIASLRIREETEDRPAARRKMLVVCVIGAVAIHAALAVAPLEFGGTAAEYGVATGDRIEVTLIAVSDDPGPAPLQFAAEETPPPPAEEQLSEMQMPDAEQPAAPHQQIAPPARPIQQRRAAAAVTPVAAKPTAASATSSERTIAKPNYLRNPPPKYPAESRKLREEGLVLLRVLVTAQGRAADVQVQRSSGFARLDEAALKAVRGWEFNPARVGLTPIACAVEVPVRFGLSGG